MNGSMLALVYREDLFPERWIFGDGQEHLLGGVTDEAPGQQIPPLGINRRVRGSARPPRRPPRVTSRR